MPDLKLSTKVPPGGEPIPQQNWPVSEYFGEQSNDLQLNAVNDLALVSGTEKLRQDLNKIFLTELGANRNFPIFGTILNGLVGEKVNFDAIRAKIRDEVQGALETMKFINEENPNDDEVPETFESLSVEQLDLGKFEARVTVITRSGKRISTDSIVIQ
jgi:hypothetical protein